MDFKAIRKFSCLAIVFSLIFTTPAWATLNLTAIPEDGGFDLRFGRISPSDFKVVKQVTLQVVNDTGEQYRVLHRLVEPLRSAEGRELPSGQFQMYPLVNSNTTGSLLTFAEAPVGSFDNVVYTSSGTGEGDSFRVVYTLTPREPQMPGTYRGRIAYVLVPVNSTASQVVVNMTVTAELAAGTQPVVEITTQADRDRLVLSSPDDFGDGTAGITEGAEIGIRVVTPLGASYRIFQTFDGMEPTNADGRRLDVSPVRVKADPARTGVVAAETTLNEARGRQLLYTSDLNGSPAELVVRYVPGEDLWLQEAGDYRGRLKFFMELDGGSGVERQDLRTLDVVFELARLFDIYVTSGGQEGVQLEFGDVSAKTGPRTSEVTIRTLTNFGEPYHIVQVASGPMMSAEGVKVPEEDFTVRAAQEEGARAASFVLKDPAPVKQGETVVCTSDPEGHPVEVTLVYELKMRPDSKGGRYTTQLGYSLVLK